MWLVVKKYLLNSCFQEALHFTNIITDYSKSALALPVQLCSVTPVAKNQKVFLLFAEMQTH